VIAIGFSPQDVTAYHLQAMDHSAPPRLRVLHLEDSDIDHHLVRRALRELSGGAALDRVDTLPTLREALVDRNYDVAIVDYRLPGFTAIDAWEAAQRLGVALPPFVLLTSAIGETAAVEAMRLGFADYLLKEDIGKLVHVLERSIEVRQALRARERADRELAASERRLAELTEHLQSTIEQERAAIAREIHDDIGGALTAVRFDLAWIGRHADAADAAMQQHLRSATGMLAHALGASQRIMMNLRPPILDQGLVAALSWMSENFARRTGVALDFRPPRERLALAPAIELVAYRTAQEALTNISKHAGARHVAIELSDDEGVLTLEVFDDGRGLPPEARDKPRAFGLRGLHERARTVGGWLDISNRNGVGTAIILSVPLDADGAAPPDEDGGVATPEPPP
jgi:signal transduction histidine kinase